MVSGIVDVDEFVEFVVVEDRPAQHDLTARRRRGFEQVLLGAHDARHRGDHLFTDGVEGRIGHLGEQFDEVVVEQLRALREHSGRGVGAHRAQWLGPRGRHRGQQDAQIFFAVAEGHLPAHHRLMVRCHAGRLGQRLEVQQPGVQPFGVGLGAGQLFFDLVVGDDSAACGVDEEHLARLQPPLRHDLGRRHVEHAALAGQDDAVVDRAPPPSGPETVAVQHRADQRAVGERHTRRSVPRLHQTSVELPERALLGRHRRAVLPGFGNHHQHGVRKITPAEVQQLENLVEGRGVGGAGCADRRKPAEVAGDLGARQHGFPGSHAVTVTAHSVDLSVVGNEAERVRQRPRREGVGGEAAVDDGDGADAAFVPQIRKVLRQLHRGEHALVDHGATGQRREVDALILGTLAQRIHTAVEIDSATAGPVTFGRCDEQLGHVGHASQCGLAHLGALGVDGHLTPAQDLQSFFVRDVLHHLACGGPFGEILRQEADARGKSVRAVIRGCGQREVHHRAE